MADHIEWDLLARFVAGTASPDERARVETWAAASAANAASLAELRSMLAAAKQLPTDIDTDASWATMRARLSAPGARRLKLSQPGADKRRRWWIPAAVAAAVALALSLTQFVGRAGRAHEYVTAAGERMDVVLSDGTRMVLAPDSRLTVRGSREVALHGEAYVVVVHNAAHPFRMLVDTTTLTDVGTTFDVRAYANERDWSVVVAEGAVDVAQTRLGHGDLAVVSDQTIRVSHGVDVNSRIAWLDGRLIFDGQPLVSVLGELSRWYGATIRLTDTTLASKPIHATYAHAPLSAVLRDLAGRYGLTWTQSGNAVVVSPRNTEHSS
jgi:transmembrane sensor